jgi:arginase family enzyme
VDVCLIKVPYHAGDERIGSSQGPDRLLEAGADELLAARGLDVTVETIERGAPFRDTAASAAQVNKQLADLVRRVIDADQLPIILSGSCNSAMGVLAGFDHGRCGTVWLDAHADFNTPESSVSGFFPGMSMAVITGHCYRNYWGQIGDNTPLAEEAVAMFGVRDLSPGAERERLERSAFNVVGWKATSSARSISWRGASTRCTCTSTSTASPPRSLPASWTTRRLAACRSRTRRRSSARPANASGYGRRRWRPTRQIATRI